jgi:phosphate transport system substrate-binding protein
MTVRWGRCRNFSKCKDAKEEQHIPIPKGAPFVCPECGEPLVDENYFSSDKAPAMPSKPGMKKPITLLVAIAALLLVGTFIGFAKWGMQHSAKAAASKTILRLAGSNTIGDTLGPALAEAFLKDQGAANVRILPGANPLDKIVEGVLPGDSTPSSITIAAHGSATAFTSLAENSCDIGMASRKIKPDEAAKLKSKGDKSSVLNEHILGLDGIAIIVNAANPANQLDKDMIMRIFTGEITDWSQVGAYRGAIKVYARNDNSGTYDTFKSLVLEGKPLAAGTQRIEDSKALSDAVAADPYGIGFIGLPYIASSKPIAVSDKGTLALLPTRLTVSTEDYLLSRRLFLYTPARPSNKYTRKFLEFVISSKGQDVVSATGFVAQNVVQVEQTAPADAPAEYKELTQDANRLSLNFRFASGQMDLDNKAKVDLERVVSLIADLNFPADKIMLFGFSDSTGDNASNLVLSQSRAKAIESQLIRRGLKPAIVRGFGSNLAIASNENEEGQARNRRVEVWIKK